ncbi:6-bladed beta-propeller [Parabacteroides sp.]|uniref:6-bladed beta-propeller n=1 Tax=Parabacteroides sp. TaxID=1869337 RepID=UPI00257EF3CF|nr:6-bladed beta-propeller [Parabacteroides sp.]
MKTILSICLFIALPFLGIGNNPKADGHLIRIPLGKEIKCPLDKLFSEYEFIALDSNDPALLEGLDIINRIIVKDDYIYVGDLFKLTLFDRSGKYVTTLNKQGQGPDSYLSLFNFTVHTNGNISILDRMASAVMTYNKSGEMISKKRFPELSLRDLTMLNDSTLILKTMGDRDSRNNIYIVNWNNGEVINSYYPVAHSKLIHMFKDFFPTYQRRVFLNGYRSNHVYELTREKLLPAYTIDVDGRIPPKDFWQSSDNSRQLEQAYSEKGYIGHIPFFMEGEQKILLRFEGASDALKSYALIDKATGKSELIKEFLFDSSFGWEPEYIFPQENGWVVIPIPAHLLFDKKGATSFANKFPDIDAESNYILCLARLK